MKQLMDGSGIPLFHIVHVRDGVQSPTYWGLGQ